ncbi:MAG: MFS transporter [Acetobacteraceae bacterium]
MTVPDDREFRRFWPVILACFCLAVYAWGFGFYGQSIYLAELRRLHGWPASWITSATTTFYLGGALLMPFVHSAMVRLGPRTVLCGGAILLGLGATGFSRAEAPWQLYVAGMAMSAGWAGTTGTAIATTLSFWFDRGRGLAISLALNGASAAGFIVAPLLVQLSQGLGLQAAVWRSVLGGLCLVLPVLLLCVGRPPARQGGGPATLAGGEDERPAFARRSQALRDGHFWSVALPFALALSAQVGFIVHMVAFLLPALGADGTSIAVSLASVAAMAGRIGLGCVIHRLHQRRASAASFLVQAVGLGLMLGMPDRAAALYAGAVLFGLSVGNVITLPAILVQREFATRSFGLIIGLSGAIGQFALALGPGLFGVLRDLTGAYAAVLVVCIGLQVTAAGLVLRRWA